MLLKKYQYYDFDNLTSDASSRIEHLTTDVVWSGRVLRAVMDMYSILKVLSPVFRGFEKK